MGQVSDEIALALLAGLGQLALGGNGPLNAVQIRLDGSQLSGQLDGRFGFPKQLVSRRGDHIQIAGKQVKGQITVDKHNHHQPQGQDHRLIGSDIGGIDGLRLGQRHTVPVLGQPVEQAADAVVQQAGNDKLQKEQADAPDRNGSHHHKEQHFQF